MVYAAAYCQSSSLEILKKHNFDDSKVLKESQRSKMFTELTESPHIGYAITSISPQDISSGMLSRSKYNLNEMAHDTTIALIRTLVSPPYSLNITEIYIDTVGPPDSYRLKLCKMFPDVPLIVVCKKADSIYPIVSAASICAKVTRDCELVNWEFVEKEDGDAFDRVFGSGYPAGKLDF